jgi:hypothetical protein
MAYFPNATAWEFWAEDNCFKCLHWPKAEDDEPCPVEMAHMLYNYQQGDEGEDCPIRTMLDMLIPRDGIANKRCAMFRASVDAEADEAERHRLAAQPAKYAAAMAECGRAAA